MNEKNKQAEKIPDKDYLEELVVFRNWLHNVGKIKLYSTLSSRNTITYDCSSIINQESSSNTISVQGKTIVDTTIEQIENIIKLFNKHKALLEASKGIE